MTLCHITDALNQTSPVCRLRSLLARGESVMVQAVTPPLKPAVAAAIAMDRPGPTLVIVPREDRADSFTTSLAEWLPRDAAIHRWPPADALPYEQLPLDRWNAGRRVALLDKLGQAESAAPFVIVASAAAITQRVLHAAELSQHVRLLKPGQRVDLDELRGWLASQGYEPVALVQEPGTLARRGGILDLFPPGADQPVRIDFFGDE
ncbi:MAG TPA: hypothetical protein VGR16_01065, partial [Thermomicrobiales bacterium]|nr:hypothetical protein [Thermomicrobiales bacterium]